MARLDVDPTHFDAIFDAVRPDTGTPVSAAEVRAGIPALGDDRRLPRCARSRRRRIGCAVFVLGNLIGTTLTHEAGHSLGLADPTGEAFHDPGDGVNRLMDAGGDRPFEERAELLGQGPAVFCGDEYIYLRTVLPGSDASQRRFDRASRLQLKYIRRVKLYGALDVAFAALYAWFGFVFTPGRSTAFNLALALVCAVLAAAGVGLLAGARWGAPAGARRLLVAARLLRHRRGSCSSSRARTCAASTDRSARAWR